MRKIRGWIMSEHDARSMLHQIEERIRSSKIEVQQSGCPDPTSFSDRGRPYDRVSGQTGNPAGARLISADLSRHSSSPGSEKPRPEVRPAGVQEGSPRQGA